MRVKITDGFTITSNESNSEAAVRRKREREREREGDLSLINDFSHKLVFF